MTKQDKGANVATKDEGKIKVHWDDSQMKTSYANVCNVSSTREEFTILFGTNQTFYSGQKELTIQLNNRLILSPFVAKRFGKLLENVVADYERRFGQLNMDVPSEGGLK